MKVGFANGCFDELHEGHLYFLACAFAQCDYLIVAINNDESVRRLKGEARPIHNLEDRIGHLIARASPWFDALIPFDGKPMALIGQILPDLIIRGWDQDREGQTLRPIIVIPRMGTISTTERLNARRGLS